MNRLSRLTAALTALAATAVLATACSRAPEKPQEYKIGVVLALTGRGATYGQESLNGIQLAVDEINEEAKKNGEPQVRIVVEDSQSEGPKTVEAFRRLIDQEKIFVAVGFTLSDEALSAAPLAEQRKVILFSPSASSDDLKNAGEYVFRNRESAALHAETVAKAAVQRFGRKTILVLHSNSANGISYRDTFVNSVARMGSPIPVTIGYDEGKSDYRQEIEELQAKNPDAVYLVGLDKELALIVKQAYEMGFKPQLFASAGAMSPRFLETAGAEAEGLICAGSPFNLESKEPHVEQFVRKYRERFGMEPEYFSATSYDAIRIIAGMMKEGVMDSDAMKARLLTIKDYPGVGGSTTFDEYGEVTKPMDLVQVKGGKFQRL
ncbi:MAG TPA: penicillin-binding protein activator [Thermoanaerobaculia bacterium]|nr:penicillin-binding protein activator [Thermoanaerobaculia bacterium]